MSDSQFQELSSQSPLASLRKQLEGKDNMIYQLQRQVKEMKEMLFQYDRQRQYYVKELQIKQQTITKLTTNTFKSSQKIIQQEQQIEKYINDMDESEKQHEELLQCQLKEKCQILMINEHLHNELNNIKQLLEEQGIQFEERVKQQQIKLTQQQMKLKQQQVKLSDKEKKLSKLDESLTLKDQQLTKLETSITSLKQQLQQVKGQASDFQKQNNELIKMHELAKQVNIKSQMRLKEQQQLKIKELKFGLEQLKEINSKFIMQIEQKKKQINKLNDASYHYIGLDQLTLEKLQRQSKQVQQLAQKTNDQSATIKHLQETILKQQRIISQHQETIGFLNLSLVQSSNLNLQLNSQLLQKESQLLALHLTTEELNKQVEKLTFPKEENQDLVGDSGNQVEGLKKQLAEASLKYSKLDKEFKEFQEILTHLSQDNDTYRQQNIGLKQQLQKTKQQIQNPPQSNQPQINHHQPQPSQQPQLQTRLTALQQENKMLICLIQYFQNQLKSEQTNPNDIKPSTENLLHLVKLMSSSIEENVSIAIKESPEKKIQTENHLKNQILTQVKNILFPNQLSSQVKPLPEQFMQNKQAYCQLPKFSQNKSPSINKKVKKICRNLDLFFE